MSSTTPSSTSAPSSSSSSTSTTPSSVSSGGEVKVSPPSPVITLAGKVAIVTGSSKGIGQSIALSLARDGATVIINYNGDEKGAQATVKAITAVGGRASAIQADVRSSADVDRLFSEGKRLHGRIDIVVANAAMAMPFTPIANISNDLADQIINLDIKGVFYTLRAAANHIENHGRIIIVGSGARQGTFPGASLYGASKAAVEVLGSTLAQELGASKGVTVNTLHPGPTLTPGLKALVTPEMQKAMANMKLGRVAQPNDIGDAVALFVSEGARWISGQAIFLTGPPQ